MVSIEKLRVMLTSGYTLRECAEEFGVSYQYIGQLRKKHFPDWKKYQWGKSKHIQDKKIDKEKERELRSGRTTTRWHDEIARAKYDYFRRKKQNAKYSKWEFTVEFSDINWVDTCPIFGTPINWTNPVRGEDSPSLDRFDPKKGYIPGNTIVLSWRANRIKNDGTAEEHRQIADFMMSQSLTVK